MHKEPASGAGTGVTPVLEVAQSEPGTIRLGAATYYVVTDRLMAASGEELLLRSQSARVLLYLVAALGTLVSREHLIAEIWGDVAVTDDSLTQCIADIRRAIGDRDHQVLKTVRKRGYILKGEAISPSLSVAAKSGANFELQEPAEQFTPDGEVPRILPQLDPRDVLPTLAVLPLRTQSLGPEAPLGIFLADEIANALCRSEDVNVISRLSTGRFRDSASDLGDMRRALNADFALSGFLIQKGDRAIVSIEFADTETQFVLWSDRLELPIDPLLRETQGIERIVAHIRNAIMLNEVRRARTRPLHDLKLFSVLHGAVGLMHRLSLTDFSLARSYLEIVTARAPDTPAPLAWLARWHVLRAVQGWAEDPQHEARQALKFTTRALDIDPDHTLALVCEGQVLAHLAHRLDEAEDRYNAALATNPNDAQGRALRGMLASFCDRGHDGKRETERALHLTPLDPHRYFFLALAAGANIALEDYSRAVVLAKESLRLNRTHVSTLRMLAVAQLGSGDVDAGRKTAVELLELQPDLSVSSWLKSSPSADFKNGRRFAKMLRELGVPD